MTRSMRSLTVAVVLSGLWLASPSVAADLDRLMHEFRVMSAGLVPAPAFSLKALDGTTAALADLRGQPVLLYFWATW